ncbi:hypothetical protein CRE_25022 [Caenorhabditis remanei]|uniref:F-box domain-containing protein n=1 Tax=Caenorhabditis remanei TaxID=31234 RepID=E3MHW8_CAERE|nr:hypothetical protein CRE_25022 [Caenorhabditis remanei]
MSAAFSLLGLPKNAQRKVLNGFDAVQLINFSLLSNNAKTLVRSLNFTIAQITLCADEDFIEIQAIVDKEQSVGWIFYPPEPSSRIQPVRGTVPIFVPNLVKAEKNFEETIYFKNPKMSISEWLTLIIEVFNHPPILDILWTKPDCLFDMKSIKGIVERFNVGSHFFTRNCGVECAQLALRTMSESRTLAIASPAFANPAEYQDILILNSKSIFIGFSFDFDLKISLDDILIINSKLIHIMSRHITDKTINRYLKHWIQGSNPRMENMRLEFEPNRIFDEEVILRGLKYRRARLIRQNQPKICIRRKDGTNGIIVLHLAETRCFDFYVSN